MKYIFISLLLFACLPIHAQDIPDSTKAEIARLTCECITLMKLENADRETGIQNFKTCARTTMDVFASAGSLPKNWQNDQKWSDNFFNELIIHLQLSCPSFQKFSDKLKETKKLPEPLPVNDARCFLADEAMKKRGMELNTNVSSSSMKRWSAKNMSTSTIQIVFDIRYSFKNIKDAADYLSGKLQELREGGAPTNDNLQSWGAEESYVFRENPTLLEQMKDFDLDIAQYNFIFRIKKIVAKVFVAASKKATYNQVLAFAKEAIARVKTIK